LSSAYRVRPATLGDADIMVRHRCSMFTDMGVPLDAAALESAFRDWLASTMPSGTYRAWLVETTVTEDDGRPDANPVVVAGGGITVLPWPPGPRYMGDRLAFVYNVYTEPAHRRRGIARLVMDAIHAWCREADITSLALNASPDGLPMYTSMGYAVAPSPMMFFALKSA
jgi:GNAT superfamily N-acetyltransferase